MPAHESDAPPGTDSGDGGSSPRPADRPPAYPVDARTPGGSDIPPAYPEATPAAGVARPRTADEAPPVYPGPGLGGEQPPAYPSVPSPSVADAPAYPSVAEAPAYPSVPSVAFPSTGDAPVYPSAGPAPAYPAVADVPGAAPGQWFPANPAPVPGPRTAQGGPQSAALPPPHANSGAAPGAYSPAPPRPEDRPGLRADQDDLEFEKGRQYLTARQRRADRAALAQIAMSVPTALISLGIVLSVFGMISALLGLLVTLAWLASGALVFHRGTEEFIARYLLGMRRPDPAEARRLEEIWAEVTRRAGVRPGTYQLWIEERRELNAMAAAGHIVAVTRHAMDRLPNSHLAAVLAHELGHHVGGHTWARMLVDWYALPARAVGRWIVLGVARLLFSGDLRGMACGGCLGFFVLGTLYILAFDEGLWWFVLLVAITPVVLAGLRRTAERRADEYAEGLGFGTELMAVLLQERQAHDMSRAGAAQGTGGAARPGPPRNPRAHADYAARLGHLENMRARRTGTPGPPGPPGPGHE